MAAQRESCQRTCSIDQIFILHLKLKTFQMTDQLSRWTCGAKWVYNGVHHCRNSMTHSILCIHCQQVLNQLWGNFLELDLGSRSAGETKRELQELSAVAYCCWSCYPGWYVFRSLQRTKKRFCTTKSKCVDKGLSWRQLESHHRPGIDSYPGFMLLHGSILGSENPPTNKVKKNKSASKQTFI